MRGQELACLRIGATGTDTRAQDDGVIAAHIRHLFGAERFGHDARLRALPIRDAKLQMSESLVTLTARRDVPVIRAFLRRLGR